MRVDPVRSDIKRVGTMRVGTMRVGGYPGVQSDAPV